MRIAVTAAPSMELSRVRRGRCDGGAKAALKGLGA